MFKMIEDIKRSKPKQREKILQDMHMKNVRYLQRVNAELANFVLMHGTGRFGIQITDDFLDIIDRQTHQCYHPPGQLLNYMHELGAWHHTAWVDRLAILPGWRGAGAHGQLVMGVLEALWKNLPQLRERMARGIAKLPVISGTRRYSGPVVFLGVFTGLHIMSYLNKTTVRDVFLIEPDLDRFALSCFFFDYEEMEKRYGHLLLHVGPNAPQSPIDQLVTKAPITASTWVRLLPAYPSEEFDDIINRVGLRWRALMEIFVPYERELQNLKNGMQNLRDGRPFPRTPPKLSENSTIAVVASGPSLNKDMTWLKKNQSRLIIMASISCVRVLKENGIRVDYQCTLDTELDEPLFQQLQMDPEVPLVAYYKFNPDLLERFKKVYLVYEDGKANVVRFHNSITHTHPTTGNFMTAFAAWCKPSRLLFVGLDLGFREARRSHVEGGWHDENEGVGHQEETAHAEHIKVEANFPESESEILTMAYYNNARFAVEDAIVALLGRCQIYNLSDGAKISGALPLRSSELNLPVYRAKKEDMAAIEQGFSTDYTGILEPYATPGQELVDGMNQALLARVKKLKKFDWVRFSEAVDVAWGDAVDYCVRQYRDLRFEIYSKVVQDALQEWYRTLVMTENPSETQRIYEVGLTAVEEMLKSLKWPEELDAGEDFLKKKAVKPAARKKAIKKAPVEG